MFLVIGALFTASSIDLGRNNDNFVPSCANKSKKAKK